MAVSPYSSSSLISPTKAINHRPTLTTLLNTTDLTAATSSFNLGDEAKDHSIELPDAPELNHELFQGEEFDPSEFLLGRRHTGLEDLRSEVSLPYSLCGLLSAVQLALNEVDSLNSRFSLLSPPLLTSLSNSHTQSKRSVLTSSLHQPAPCLPRNPSNLAHRSHKSRI